jgi:hypothetical protein
MRAFIAPLALSLACLASHVSAQGCPPENGETVSEIENFNQLIIDADVEGLSAGLDEAGVDATAIVKVLAENFTQGFSGCTTLVQRSDIGTMKQTVVAFSGSGPVVYFYWRTATIRDKFYVISLSLQTEQSKIFDDFF